MQPWTELAECIVRTEGDDAATRFLIEEAGRRLDTGRDGFDIAMRLKAQGQLQPALDILSALLDRGPDHVRFHAMLERASCLRLLGRSDAAQAQLAAARSHDPGSHWPLQGFAEMALDANDPDQALSLVASGFEALRPDGRAALARTYAGILAAARFPRTLAHQGGAAPRNPGPIPALHRAGLIMMVKDEDDILAANLEHHHALGFRCFCILDNASSDLTAAHVAAFRDRHPAALVLSVFDQLTGYYQSDKMAIFQDTLIRYARLAGIGLDWMFFVDADEFIAFCGADDRTGREALGAILEDKQARLLVMHWINAATPDLLHALPPDVDPFALFTRRMSRLQPVSPKIAFRTELGLQPMMGNHFVDVFDYPLETVRVLACDDWYMMHYPLRSLQQVRTKVINGGRAFRDSIGLETHGGHWRARYDAYLAGGEAALRQILQQHIDAVG